MIVQKVSIFFAAVAVVIACADMFRAIVLEALKSTSVQNEAAIYQREASSATTNDKKRRLINHVMKKGWVWIDRENTPREKFDHNKYCFIVIGNDIFFKEV